jgi:hypothetical protein
MAYSCRVPPFRREWEHHILNVAPDSSPGVGRDSHIQLESAALSWLYRVLCDDCKRASGNANLSGCAYLLQV